jgi:hypothetical protein
MNGWGTLRALLAGAMTVLALVGALLGAGPAQAKPKRFVIPESFEMHVELPKSHGYSVGITSTDHRHIVLTAAKGSLIATYEVVGRANRNRLDADFGSLGHVSLRFQSARRHIGEPHPHCEGKPALGEVGTMRGTVRFTGTNDLLDTSASRVRAEAVHSFRQVCTPRRLPGGRGSDSFGVGKPHPHPHPAPERLLRRLDRGVLRGSGPEEEPPTLLFAKRGRLELAVVSIPKFLMIAVAGEKETVGRVRVSRSVLTIADPRLVVSDHSTQSLQVTIGLPKPFSGHGKYVATPGADPSWTGSLRVPLPGAGTVPLTGPEFDVKACQPQTKEEADACAKQIRSQSISRLALYGSGSHSQALAEARLSSSR